MEHISVEHWDSSSALSSAHMEPRSNGSDSARCRITFSFGSTKERNVFRMTSLLAVGSSEAGAAVNTTEGLSATSGRFHCKCARRSALRCLQVFLGIPRSKTQGPSPVCSSGRSTAAGVSMFEVQGPSPVCSARRSTAVGASSAEAIDATVVVLVIASALAFPRLH